MLSKSISRQGEFLICARAPNLRLVKLKNRIICFLLLASLLYPAIAYSTPADVIDISDNKYFDAVHSNLAKAKESIYVSLFGITVTGHDKLSLPYLLLQDLIAAHKRGVKVVVRLNRSYDYIDRTEAGKRKMAWQSVAKTMQFL